VTLQHADCAQLPFADGTFDAITCGYGVRNFAQLDQSLAEMYRVLRPGGQLRILEFTYPTNPLIRFFYDFYLTRVMPRIGKRLTQQGDSFVYFMNSIKRFDKGNAFLAHLEKVGFAETRYKQQTFGISSLYMACKK
jgi:demethylmenaquinone methyltransferase/2-methoxy-6-polyprenyl-1,4-benzoquinol methylase